MSEAAGVLVTILWALREGRDPTPEVGLSVIEYLSMTQFWISDAKLDHRNRRFQLICPCFYCFFSLLRRCYKNTTAQGEKRKPRGRCIFYYHGRSYARKKKETVGVARNEAVLSALSARNIADPADRSRSGSRTGDLEQ